MSKSSKKISSVEIKETQLQLLYGEDSSFKYWESYLFNEVYLRRDLPEKHSDIWDNTESIEFQNFMNVIRNLAEEYKDREKELLNWSETETINNWVKHVLEGLGWKDNCTGVQNPFLEETSFRYDSKTYRTDILIVDHPKDKQYVNEAKGDDKLTEARTSVIMPVEVKYWQRLEQYRQGHKEQSGRRDIESDDLEKIATPNEQTTQYMSILKKDWGILTDGAKWRLFNSDLSAEDSNRYYEFNLYSLIEAINTADTEADRAEVLNASKYFYHFFSKSTFYSKEDGKESFVSEILRYSKKYVNKVEEDLKDRFVKAMNIACNGFYKSSKKNALSKDLSVIRNAAESSLFNILFIKSLESRGILPMNSTDYKKISLSNTIDKIERFDPDKDELLNTRELNRAFKKGNGNSFDYSPTGTELHERILRLTMVIHDGNSSKDDFGFEISGFTESIFSDDEWKFFKTAKLQNDEWVRILFQLGYADSDSLNRKYQQIPYNFFTPRQLGSIYESFLEFTLEIADCDMVFSKRQWQKADLNSKKLKNTNLPTVKKGFLFFTPNNKDRKATGSYYTPDAIVQYVVHQALYPLVKNKSSEEILKIKICDPSMGSGHFLVSALNYLTKAIISSNSTKFTSDSLVTTDTIRREVLDKCVFGVDINPRSVKLAKMSLWLESAEINGKLENLDDQIKCGDSLVDSSAYANSFSWDKEFFKEKKFQGFDALVGNPPWDKVKSNDLDFFRRHSATYGMNSGTANNKEKEKLLKDSKIAKEYEDYNNQNIQMLEYFKKSKDYSNQVVDVDGRKTGGDANKYRLFCERYYRILNKNGRIGIVLPHSVLSDNGATGIRRLFLNEIGLESVIGFENHYNGKEIFPGVARNMKVVCLILSTTGSKDKYFSKFIKNPNAIIGEDLILVEKEKFEKFTGERNDILCFPDSESQKINEKLCQLESLSRNKYFENIVVRDGEAHMTSTKKYFTEEKTPYKLVTGRNFTCFTSIYDIDTYVQPIFPKDRPECNESRILIKAIMPNSIKKIQATLVSKNHVASNNLFSIPLVDNDLDKTKVLLGILNSDLMEFRIRSLLSNFRLLHRHISDLPMSDKIFDKLKKSGIVKLVDQLNEEKKNSDSILKKLNQVVFSAYEISKSEQDCVEKYIYENAKIDEEDDSSDLEVAS